MKQDKETLIDVIEALELATSGYSEEFPPDRVVRIRSFIKKLKKDVSP